VQTFRKCRAGLSATAGLSCYIHDHDGSKTLLQMFYFTCNHAFRSSRLQKWSVTSAQNLVAYLGNGHTNRIGATRNYNQSIIINSNRTTPALTWTDHVLVLHSECSSQNLSSRHQCTCHQSSSSSCARRLTPPRIHKMTRCTWRFNKQLTTQTTDQSPCTQIPSQSTSFSDSLMCL